MITKARHKWAMEEDQIIAEEVFKTFVAPMSVEVFIDKLRKKLPNIDPDSLKMRISNIKAILTEDMVPNSLNIGILKNYAQQTMKAVVECYDKYETPKTKERNKLIEEQKQERRNRRLAKAAIKEIKAAIKKK